VLVTAQSITLPSEVKGSRGAWIIIAPEKVDGGKPKWRLDPGLQEVRLDLLLPPEVLAQLRGKVVTASENGRYRVEAWNAKADVASEIATCWVIVNGGPTPPPPPPPPPPSDPLTKRLQSAYDRDTDLDKSVYLPRMVEVYESVPGLLSNARTLGHLFDALNAARKSQIGERLLQIRTEAGAYLVEQLGKEDLAFTPDLQDRARNVFLALAKAMKGVR
jgi:hypothetical protein